MYRELRPKREVIVADDERTAIVEGPPRSKTFLAAAIQITLADLSMSLDNVLVVAGIARENPAVLFIGLTITVLIMGIASTFVARLIQRYPWIAWIGLVLILYVAVRMIFEGWVDPAVGLGRLFG
jgi:predicted tellurium resistance membrane protein TerC